MRWARVENGIVHEITDSDPTNRFIPTWVWVRCPDGQDVQHQWTYSGGTFAPAVPPVITTQEALVALAHELVVREATGISFTPSGTNTPVMFSTDASAVTRYTAEWSAIQASLRTDGDVMIAADGTPVALSNTDASDMIKKALSYFRACVARYASLRVLVLQSAATPIDTGWPSNL